MKVKKVVSNLFDKFELTDEGTKTKRNHKEENIVEKQKKKDRTLWRAIITAHEERKQSHAILFLLTEVHVWSLICFYKCASQFRLLKSFQSKDLPIELMKAEDRPIKTLPS